MQEKVASTYIENLCVDLFKGIKESIIKSTIEEHPDVNEEDIQNFVDETLKIKKKEVKAQVQGLIDEVGEKL